ncbi:MAG: ABC transporter permease, partial [Acidobacteriota bacterium]|nr:ABC transporter permease [Acidobacteriota bacterium]
MPLLPGRLHRTIRRLLRAPGFTVVAVLTLGLGIGANAAIFSVVNGVLLRPLPYPDADRLAGVWHSAPGMNIPVMNQSPATYLTYREDGRVFDDIGLWDNGSVSVTGAGEPERIEALFVTDGTLAVLGVQAALGRRFSREDDAPGSPQRVLLTHGYWQRKLGADPSVLGRPLMVDGAPREIIGVLPAAFKFLNSAPQILLPFQFDRAKLFIGNFSYQALARLKPGVTLEQANADIARMLPLVIERFPLPSGLTRQMFDEVRMAPNVRPLSVDVVGDIGRTLWVLLGTVGLVLLIACANVANLFLVRAEGRQQELAIHAALGASRRRIGWELLSESLALALVGGVAGLVLAQAAIRLLIAMAPEGLPRVDEIQLDSTVLVFTGCISLLAGLLFGLVPVLRFANPHLASALKEGGRASSDGKSRHRVRNVLVVAEIALAVVLLVGSGLMMRTFQAMRRVDPGFTGPAEVLTLRVSIPESLVQDKEQAARTHEQIARRIEQIPGVTAVGLSSSITMDGNDSNDPIFVEDFPGAGGQMPPLRRFKWIAENYFESMGNRLLAGRPISWNDVYTQAPVVVVTENFAREHWKEPAAAVGRRIRQNPKNPWRTIVGVVGDARDDGVAQPAPAIMYWPMMMADFWDQPLMVQRNMGYAVRTSRAGSPTLLKEIQQAVWSVNASVPVARVRTLDQLRSESMAQTSFMLVMLAIAAAVALLLGVVGIYGVIAYVATQRTREIGIRIALGAEGRDVTRLFLRQGLLLAGAGIAVGVAASAGATRALSALLYGVSALDPLTYAAVAAGLA